MTRDGELGGSPGQDGRPVTNRSAADVMPTIPTPTVGPTAATGAQTQGRAAAMPTPRGRIRPDLVYLGWQHAPRWADAGPMPEPESAVAPIELTAGRLAALRRQQHGLAGRARVWAAVSLAAAGGLVGCWQASVLPTGLVLVTALIGVLAAAAGLRNLVRGERALRGQIRAEANRVQRTRAAQLAERAALRAEHARHFRGWQRRSVQALRQPRWYPVTLPAEVGRLDVAGGTPAGWSALVTMIAATRLAAGAEVTVLDLTEGGITADLIALASSWGISPVVSVLPGDLPGLDLGLGLSSESLAEVLALTAAASAGGEGSTADQARDAALLSRVLEELGPGASIGQLNAALRALARIGDPRELLAGGELSADQLAGLAVMFGTGAERLITDRALALEAQLRVLSPLGTAPTGQRQSRLRVAWPDRHAPVTRNKVLASFLAVAFTEVLRQAPVSRPWQQTICLLGADRLPADVVDRACAAAEAAHAGLVLGYQSIPPAVRDRLGRGNAAVAFMRLGNAQDARAAAEQIGTEHRFVVSQLTDTVGTAVTDTSGDSYTSTIGTADSVTESGSVTSTTGSSHGHGRTRHGPPGPFAELGGSDSKDASTSAAISDSWSLTAGISTGTSWGLSTSHAVGANSSLAGTMQRSRELLVEPHELQHLPQSAVLVCQDWPGGRRVMLADANPAIMTLPTATWARPSPVASPQPPPGLQLRYGS